jgi:hypothetical protein
LKKLKTPGSARWSNSLGLILMIALFTAGSYWGFYSPNLKQKFAYNSFSQIDVSDPDSPAAVRYVIGLYSLKKFAYGLSFESEFYPVSHILAETSSSKIPGPYALQIKNGRQEISGAIQRWSHSFYKLNQHIASPLTGYARQNTTNVMLMVENKLPYDLIDCLIYYRKRFLNVADIMAGSRQIIKINLAKLKQKEFFNEHEVEAITGRFGGNGHAAYLRKAQRLLTPDLLLEIHNKYRSRSDSMLLIGWMQAGLIKPRFGPTHPAGGGISMINWELPVEMSL